MISIRGPRQVAKPKQKPQRVGDRIRRWAATPTNCRACSGVRRVVGKVMQKR